MSFTTLNKVIRICRIIKKSFGESTEVETLCQFVNNLLLSGECKNQKEVLEKLINTEEILSDMIAHLGG